MLMVNLRGWAVAPNVRLRVTAHQAASAYRQFHNLILVSTKSGEYQSNALPIQAEVIFGKALFFGLVEPFLPLLGWECRDFLVMAPAQIRSPETELHSFGHPHGFS